MSPALTVILTSADAARRLWYGGVCNRNEPSEFPGADVSLEDIEAVVRQTLEEEHSVPMSMAVAATLEMYWGWTAMAGVRLDPETGRPQELHHWNVLPDMTVLEHAGGDGVRLIGPEDPARRLYRMEWSAHHNPGRPDSPELSSCWWDGRYDLEHILRFRELKQEEMTPAMAP